jgi:hypothetical protein
VERVLSKKRHHEHQRDETLDCVVTKGLAPPAMELDDDVQIVFEGNQDENNERHAQEEQQEDMEIDNVEDLPDPDDVSESDTSSTVSYISDEGVGSSEESS